jgi:hypothetical protein
VRATNEEGRSTGPTWSSAREGGAGVGRRQRGVYRRSAAIRAVISAATLARTSCYDEVLGIHIVDKLVERRTVEWTKRLLKQNEFVCLGRKDCHIPDSVLVAGRSLG